MKVFTDGCRVRVGVDEDRCIEVAVNIDGNRCRGIRRPRRATLVNGRHKNLNKNRTKYRFQFSTYLANVGSQRVLHGNRYLYLVGKNEEEIIWTENK